MWSVGRHRHVAEHGAEHDLKVDQDARHDRQDANRAAATGNRNCVDSLSPSRRCEYGHCDRERKE